MGTKKEPPKDRHTTPRAFLVISQTHHELLGKLCKKHRRTKKAEAELAIEEAAKRAGIN